MSNFKYDINAVYRPSENYSIEDLCENLKIKEALMGNDNLPKNFNSYFYGSKKSSLLSKLNSLLDFDMIKLCKDNHKEKFDMLKILYLLYDVEKSGLPRNRQDYNLEDRRVLITNILANHSFENIKNVFSTRSVYGDVFNKLYDNIRSQVNDADARIDIFEDINFKWYQLAHIYIDKYVLSYDAVFNPETTLKDLERIYHYLTVEILNKLQTASPLNIKYKEGIMKSFFNILNSHELMCYNFEKIRINNQLNADYDVLQSYIQLNRKYCHKKVKWDLLPYMKKNIKYVNYTIATNDIIEFEKLLFHTINNMEDYNRNEILTILVNLKNIVSNSDIIIISKTLDSLIVNFEKQSITKILTRLNKLAMNFEAIHILWFVSEFIGIDKSDFTHYRYALDNIKNFSKIILSTRDLDIEDEISFDLFLAFMQEMLSVKKEGGTIKSLYYGRKNSDVSLKNSIIYCEDSTAVANLSMISKIENRIAINYGQYKNLEIATEIENILYEIKRIIFQYRNLNDLIYVNDFIFYLVDRAIVRSDEAEYIKICFERVLQHMLQINNFDLKIIPISQNHPVYDLFRELCKYGKPALCEMLNTLCKIITDFFTSETKDSIQNFYVKTYTGRINSVLSFSINKKNNSLEYIDYKPYISKTKLKALKLQSFIYEIESSKTQLFRADLSKKKHC